MANELSLNQTVQAEVGEFNYLYVNGEEITNGNDLDLIFDPDSDDHTQSIIDALIEATTTGRTLYVRAGTYIIKSPIQINLIQSLKVVCDPAVIFKVDSSFPKNEKVFQFLRDQSLGGVLFDWYGSEIDGSDMPIKDAGAPDLMSIESTKIKDVTIRSVFFKANIREGGVLRNRGDSCLFLARGENYLVTECTFLGALDACIYVSGTSSGPAAGKNCIITNNIFADYHEVGIISKREFENHVISNNIIEGGRSGIVIGGEADGTRLPGRHAVISGNFLTNIYYTGIEARKSNYTVITNNKIEAFSSEAESRGIRIAGSSHCVVNGNIIDASVDDNIEYGIYITNWGFNSEVYSSLHTLVSDNSIQNCEYGIYENPGTLYSVITDNQLDGNGTNIKFNVPIPDANGAIIGAAFSQNVDHSEGTCDFKWAQDDTTVAMSIATGTQTRPEGIYLGYNIYDKAGNVILGTPGGTPLDASLLDDLSTNVQALQSRIGTVESLINLLTNDNTNDTGIEYRISRVEKAITAIKAIHDAKKSVYNIPIDW